MGGNANQISGAIGRGIRTGIYLGREVRKNRQIQLANELNGFDVQDGQYIRNEYGRNLDELKLRKTEDLLKLQDQKDIAYDNLMINQLASTAYKDIAKGNIKEGWRLASTNPYLQKQYNDAGIYNISAVDTINDADELEAKGIARGSITTATKLRALNAGYVKVTDAKGSTSILSQEELNTKVGTNLLGKTDNEGRIKLYNRANEILLGKRIPSDLSMDSMEAKLKAQIVSDDIKTTINNLKLGSLVDTITNNPNLTNKELLAEISKVKTKDITETEQLKLRKQEN